MILQKSEGVPLADLTAAILKALDPDRLEEKARTAYSLAKGEAPSASRLIGVQNQALSQFSG